MDKVTIERAKELLKEFGALMKKEGCACVAGFYLAEKDRVDTFNGMLLGGGDADDVLKLIEPLLMNKEVLAAMAKQVEAKKEINNTSVTLQ